ncbi:uncharacterized protein [Primulina eburnea]|uniref:uncharacterized protein n=1 Tax=Primulina eburnea TaxID=1245227 RepID=UPI003C6C5BA5
MTRHEFLKMIEVHHRWVQDLAEPIPFSSAELYLDARVADLITENEWNTSKIIRNFMPYVQQMITTMPVPSFSNPDARYWKFDSKGRYSVKGGYQKAIGFYDNPKNQSRNMLEGWWKFIWSISVPPKVRIFWWRLSKDLIPTASNLKMHHIPTAETCHYCGFGKESTIHALFTCHQSREVWKQTTYWSWIKKITNAPTLEICLWLKWTLTKTDFENLAVYTWAFWKARQTAYHGKISAISGMDIHWVLGWLKDYKKAQRSLHVTTQPEPQNSALYWTPPIENHWKLNVDACFNLNSQSFGIAGIVRGSNGEAILAFGRQINQPLSVLGAELLAIKYGILELKEHNLTSVTIETDSLLSKQAVFGEEDYLDYEGIWISEIKEMMKSVAVDNLVHVRRSANVIANALASFSSSSPTPFSWVNGEFPT